MGNIYFTSDTHFGHKNIIKYSQRPFADIQDMDENLIKNWNAIVSDNDTIWHLGDFAFMNSVQFETLLSRLNGHINIVLGNHDDVIIKSKLDLIKSSKIESIQQYKEINFDHKMLVLFHYGQRVWNKSHHGSIHLYGHSHGSLPPHGLSVDVGVDCKEITSEYRPVSLDEIFQYMSSRSISEIDHHIRK